MSSDAVARLRLGLLASFLLLLLMTPASRVGAEDSIIQTRVCNPSTGSTAQLTITQPVNDSVTNTGAVPVSGTVQDVSQIDIEIDGIYSQTIAIGAAQTSFSSTVQLSSGTHTITVNGIDVCALDDPSASVVVTYQPDTQPSTGSETPTTPSGGSPTVGTPSTGDAPREPAADAEWVQSIPLLPEALEVIRDVGRSLDFDQTGNGGVWKGIARFLLFTAGIILLLGGPWLLARLERREKFEASVSRYMETGMRTSAVVSHLQRNSWLLRGFGAVLILLTFAI